VFAGGFGEESGYRPDGGSGHARHDGLKRVRVDRSLDLGRDLIALPPQCRRLRAKRRNHQRRRVRAGGDDGLLAEPWR